MAKQTFTTGQVLLASQLTSLQQTAMNGGAFSSKTSSYTAVAADAGTAISMTSTSATTITINSGLFAAGDTILITNLGSGACVITAGTATVNTAGSLSLSQYETGILHFVSASSAVFNDYVQAATGTTYAIFQDQKSQNTNAGVFTSGAWRTRDLNTSVANTITSASLASNQITLPAGTYVITAYAQAEQVNLHQLRFYNITDSSEAIAGLPQMTETAGYGANTAILVGNVVITASKVFELQHRCQTTKNETIAMGRAGNFTGERYGTVIIEKVA